MGVIEVTQEMLAAKFGAIFPHLDERQRRLLMGAEARALGHGGIRLVARAAGVREATVSLGVTELDSGGEPLGRARRPGGGRKRAADLDPGLRPALLALVEPEERGDPMSPLRWTTKSTRTLAGELTAQGHKVSADTVGDLLREEGFSLQGNAKTIEGRRHPDRDAQFRYINEQVRAHQASADPVVSVDTKKKELVGQFKNGGRDWRPKGEPVATRTHDFPGDSQGKAIPYGVYDLTANAGWVNVGTDHDTASFAVESIRRWWKAAGQIDYPQARRLLITADAGGSNGYRTRAWKAELAAFAAETGLEITCCHFPPGTSKWNKVEHRLFSAITMNWRGRPLASHEVIVNTIAATTTRTGLRVHAQLDTSSYDTGVKVSDEQMAALPITRHDWHGDWNYTLHPQTAARRGQPGATPGQGPPGRWDREALAHPALTGLSRQDLNSLITELGATWSAHRERGLRQRRGGDRRRAAGAGARPKLDLAGRILATLLHLRLCLPQPVIALLLGVDRTTITRAIGVGRHLIEHHNITIEPAPVRLCTLADLSAYAAASGITLEAEIKTAC
jgi:transposase